MPIGPNREARLEWEKELLIHLVEELQFPAVDFDLVQATLKLINTIDRVPDDVLEAFHDALAEWEEDVMGEPLGLNFHVQGECHTAEQYCSAYVTKWKEWKAAVAAAAKKEKEAQNAQSE